LIFEVLLTTKNAKKKYAKDTKKPMTENKMIYKIFFKLPFQSNELVIKKWF